MSTTPEPLDPRLQIALPAFEGPLDLLLHLIRRHELDILDLPIAFVTERYLSYLGLMEQLNLDIAAEYLVMAATLAHIKSKMLLPQVPADQVEDEITEDEIDPRVELIRRLLEYQKYKAVAEELGARGIAGRDVFVRGSDAPEASGPAPLAVPGLFTLLDAFHAVLRRAKADLAFEIAAEGMSIQDRMRQLVELLGTRRELTFEALFENQASVYDLVITFLALLEMAKRRLVRIYQADPASPIHLRSTVLVEDGEQGRSEPIEASVAPVEPDSASVEASDAPIEPAEAPGESDAASEELGEGPKELGAAPEELDAAPEELDAAPEEEGLDQDGGSVIESDSEREDPPR